MYSNNL